MQNQTPSGIPICRLHLLPTAGPSWCWCWREPCDYPPRSVSQCGGGGDNGNDADDDDKDDHKPDTSNWVAVKELNLSYYVGEALLLSIYIYIHITIMVTKSKFPVLPSRAWPPSSSFVARLWNQGFKEDGMAPHRNCPHTLGGPPTL